MRDREGEEADRDVAREVIEEFSPTKPGWVTTNIGADRATWRRRFARCASLARERERRRIGRCLVANPTNAEGEG